jgi:hypothetical protein
MLCGDFKLCSVLMVGIFGALAWLVHSLITYVIAILNIGGTQSKLFKTIISDGNLGINKERQAATHHDQDNHDPIGRYFAVNDLVIHLIDF